MVRLGWGAGGGTAGLGPERLALRGVCGEAGGGGREEDLDGSGVDWLHLGNLVNVFLVMLRLEITVVL